jgi:uncharacterized phage protein (TIGR02218 family)
LARNTIGGGVMRKLSPELEHHLSEEVTSLAGCYLITLKDQTKKAFTDYIEDLLIEGVLYKANSGFSKSAIVSNSNFNIDNLEIEAILDEENITENDLMSGVYDMAQIEIFLVNYLAPNMGKIILKTGYLSGVTLKQGRFSVEIMGLAHKLMSNISAVFSNHCRANLGDEFCKYKPSVIDGVISRVASNNSWIDDSLNQANGYFNYGFVKFKTGKNMGKSFEVKDFLEKKIITCLNLPYKIEEGQQYQIMVGCDKSFSSCVNKFNNAINFRGEPFIERVF